MKANELMSQIPLNNDTIRNLMTTKAAAADKTEALTNDKFSKLLLNVAGGAGGGGAGGNRSVCVSAADMHNVSLDLSDINAVL